MRACLRVHIERERERERLGGEPILFVENIRVMIGFADWQFPTPVGIKIRDRNRIVLFLIRHKRENLSGKEKVEEILCN